MFGRSRLAIGVGAGLTIGFLALIVIVGTTLWLVERGNSLFEQSALQRMTDTRTPEHATSVLIDAVRTWAEPSHRPGVEGTALDLLREASGRMSIDGITTRTGASARHLRRTIRRRAGVSLKQYARTVRFLAAVAQADRATVPRWARIAADAGFCDQSHLVRESRALCGLAPAAVDRERRSEAGTSNRRRTR